jgi:hypothetical protein
MRALARDVNERPASASDWLDEFETAAGKVKSDTLQEARVVIMAPTGAEVYVDDERQGSVGRSGRVVLTSIVPGKHVLRVAHSGNPDDERVIEIRPDGAEQIIQAQFRGTPSSDHLTPSRGGSLDSRTGPISSPAIVSCMRCGKRFAAGVKFCGNCGNTTFQNIDTGQLPAPVSTRPAPAAYPAQNRSTILVCPRCRAPSAAGIKFCGKCGLPLGTAALDWKTPRPVEVFCKLCNSSYPAGTLFCGRCGKPIRP